MFLIPRNVLKQLAAKLSIREALPRFLHLDDGLLLLQEKVHPRGAPGVAGSPLLRTYIIKEQPKQSMEKVLNVILVCYIERGAVLVP